MSGLRVKAIRSFVSGACFYHDCRVAERSHSHFRTHQGLDRRRVARGVHVDEAEAELLTIARPRVRGGEPEGDLRRKVMESRFVSNGLEEEMGSPPGSFCNHGL
jgi:hypothetical protein